ASGGALRQGKIPLTESLLRLAGPMATRIPQLQRFIHSHYFFGGLRQAIGVMLPALLAGGLWQAYGIGMIAAIGAACVAVIDQPGSPRRYSVNTMLGAVLLGTLTVAVTG